MSRLVLVTGGTRGIGAAIAKALKSKGYRVISTYIGNQEKADLFKKENDIPVHQWDVSRFDACQKGISEITTQFGPIDILVNNAGITRDGFLHKSTPEMWGDVIATNLTSCFNTSRCVIESMRERGFGRIINISSINGLKGQAGQVNYSAAKAGVIGFTKALSLENANKGITVNAIAPGYVDTEMVRSVAPEILEKIVSQVPTGRLAQTTEIARAVVFLADDEAGFITGATLNLNGGQYLS